MPKDSKTKSKKSSSKDKSEKSSKPISKKSSLKSSKSKSKDKISKVDSTSQLDKNEIKLPEDTQNPQNDNNINNIIPLSSPNNNNNNFNANNNNILNNSNSQQNYFGQKCEGCYNGDAICYCEECNKLYCNICDEQVHIIPALSNHIRVSFNDIYKQKKLCYHHQKIFEFYCESCNEPICSKCQIIGPHNTDLHRIISINEAFNKKHLQLSNLKPQLLNKLNELNYFNTIINDLIKKITNSKKDLERNIRKQFTFLSEKIKDIEGKKNAVLSFEINQLQTQSNSIQDIINYVNDMTNSNNNDVINFLLQYKKIDENINKIIEKPIKEKIDLSFIEDFPNDLEERHKKINDFDKVKKEIEKRDETIWEIVNEKRKKERELIRKAKEKSDNIISEWVAKCDSYEEQLKKYKVVCAFCGKYLEKNIINNDCEQNINFYLNFYLTKNSPPEEFLNSKRHFFGEPVDNFDDVFEKANELWKEQQEEMFKRRKEEEERKRQEEIEKIRIQEEERQKKILEEKERKEIEDKIRKEVQLKAFKEEEMKKARLIISKKYPEVKLKKSSSDPDIKKTNMKFLGNPQYLHIKNWIYKFVNKIKNENINLQDFLKNYDEDNDGYIDLEQLNSALNELNMELNENDFENMLNFFEFNDLNKINIVDFANNFNKDSKYFNNLILNYQNNNNEINEREFSKTLGNNS